MYIYVYVYVYIYIGVCVCVCVYESRYLQGALQTFLSGGQSALV